jgi:hypothetical protein
MVNSDTKEQASLTAAFSTTDLDLASFLACRGIEPSEVRPPLRITFPNFATFVYEGCDDLAASIAAWSDEDEPLTVDLRSFLTKRHEYYRLVRSLRGGR